MAYAIRNVESWKLAKTKEGVTMSYLTKQDAQRQLTRRVNAGVMVAGEWQVVDLNDLTEQEPTVDTINMMTGNPCKIRASAKGTCCDPATESYWSM